MVRIIERRESQDGSVKYAFANEVEHKFEAIYFTYERFRGPEPTKVHAVCLSSQAGCSAGCTFCATGYGGFSGNLSAEDLLMQAQLVEDELRSAGRGPVSIYALMGMGEPLLNLPAVVDFYRVMTKTPGRLERLYLSTVGITPKVVELADMEDVSFKLFVSVHSPYDRERERIIPISRKYPLNDLIKACRYYAHRKGERVRASYLLLKGVNDSEKHAQDFSALLDPAAFDVQLLLFNPIEGAPYERPNMADVERFQGILLQSGISTTIQISRGLDIGGGCGQLVRDHVGKTRLVH